ncbi:hypothetical protein JCM10449v2_007477 [Rhodotorula kratochvilovae]
MTPTLPLELQLDILELAIPPIAYGAFADVHEAARNLALVCRAWRAPAQRRLFEAQTVDISIAERRPGEIMRAGKSLAELVRRLAVARDKGCASVALQLRATGLLGRPSEAPLSRFHHLGSNARIIDRVFIKTNHDFAPVLAVIALALPDLRELDHDVDSGYLPRWPRKSTVPPRVERLAVRGISFRPYIPPYTSLTCLLIHHTCLNGRPVPLPSLCILGVSDFGVDRAFVESSAHLVGDPAGAVLNKVHLPSLETLALCTSLASFEDDETSAAASSARSAGVKVQVLPLKTRLNQAHLGAWAAGLTKMSTFSYVAARRVETWQGGPTVIVD